jgi:Protein of unknown function (DUF2931)
MMRMMKNNSLAYSRTAFLALGQRAGLLLAIALLFSACQSKPARPAMPAYQTDKFRLSAGPGAADGYTATIDEAHFITSTGSFPVPWGHTLTSSWIGSGIGWAVGDEMQSAPDSLEIRWFSYAEDKFYEGHFLLPQERIYQLLKQGYWNPELRKQETYDELTVCVLPTGGVVVWLAASYNKVLIGRYQGVEIEYDYARHRPKVDRTLDVRETRAAMPAEVQAEIAAGTLSSKKWDAYLKQYPWKIEFSQPVTLTNYLITYRSAEFTRAPTTPDTVAYAQALLSQQLRAVPQDLDLYLTAAYGRQRLVRVDPFDEIETMSAFQTLHDKYPHEPITLHYEVDERVTQSTLSLRAGGQTIPLPKSKVEVFSTN